MRKATWRGLPLGLFALTFGSPVRESQALHGLVSLAGLAGYILLSLDPPVATPRQRMLLVAGAVCSIAAFLLVVSGPPLPVLVAARVLAVATVALPLWLVARPPQFAFVAAGAIALLTPLLHGAYPPRLHAYVR